ncbi:hypothetical protein [Planococcus sp. YIM B11945]|uniref:hypothetical protein n=1 Tax=Planococcus sp. YIM B11945 TaxID=3435410 RepID=UPI003D7C6D16
MEVYIVFTDTKTAFSKLIKFYTQHAYSHVSLSFDPGLDQMYSFGRKDGMSGSSIGFVKEDKNMKLFQRAHCAIAKFPVPEKSYYKMRKCIKDMEKNQEHYKYNMTGLFGVVMKKELQRSNAYFCSQFVAEVLMQAGLNISDKPSGLVMPSDLYSLEQLEFIYTGALNAYPLLDSIPYGYEEEPLLMEAL